MLECALEARPSFQVLALRNIKAAKDLRKQADGILDLNIRQRLRIVEIQFAQEALDFRKCAHFCTLHLR